MKIVFFGTPDYVIPVLKAIDKYHDLIAVITQSPKEAGRKKIKTYSPVDKYAHKKNIPIYYDFDNIPSADIGVCASFGKIIPKNVLNIYKYGILNIHPSLLPRFRGASPVQQNIIDDPENTGATVIKLTEKMDAGPVVSSFKDEFLPQDTGETLRRRLFEKSAQFLIDLIPVYTKGKIKLKSQDESKATYTKILTRRDGFVDLTKDNPEIIHRKYKAFLPWPGIWTEIEMQNTQTKKRLKILDCDLEEGKLILKKVQLEGKNPILWEQFKQGNSKFELIHSS